MTRHRWSREAVIEAILARLRNGLALHRTWREDRALYHAAKPYFGNWQKALAAAGQPVRPFRKWTKTRVLEALHCRLRAGHSLDTLWREDKGLLSAAVAYFGSWQNARAAVGLKRRRARRWTRQCVLDAIRRRHAQGWSLVTVRRDDPSLYSAAARYFGSWSQARVAAGLPPTYRPWSQPAILAAIQARHTSPGKRRWDPVLYDAARRRFGSWAAAHRAAGIEPPMARRWNKHRVVEAIRQQTTEGLSPAEIWREDPGLAGAAAKFCGGRRSALLAAGVQPKDRAWSQDAVIEELRRTYPRLTTGLSTANRRLARAAYLYFGSIPRAIRAAGLEPRPRKWSRERLIEAIQDRHVKRLPLSCSGPHVDIMLVSAAKLHFGKWRSALKAAGVPCPNRRKRWGRQRVLNAVQAHYRGGAEAARGRKPSPHLRDAAYRCFGSWQAALQTAGLALPPPKKTWNQETLTDELRARHAERLPVTWERNLDIAYAARKLCGSWTAALRAAGLPIHRIRWTRQRVIQEIQDRFGQGLSLSSGIPANYSLATAAAHHVGSWSHAKRVAGIPEGKPPSTSVDPPHDTPRRHSPNRPTRPAAVEAPRKRRPARRPSPV